MRSSSTKVGLVLVVVGAAIMGLTGTSHAATQKIEAESVPKPAIWDYVDDSHASGGRYTVSGSPLPHVPTVFSFTTAGPASIDLRGMRLPWVASARLKIDADPWITCDIDPHSPTLYQVSICAPVAVAQAGAHTFSVEFFSGDGPRIDYIEITDVDPPPTTTTTSTSTSTTTTVPPTTTTTVPPTTTTTTVPPTTSTTTPPLTPQEVAAACQWEWGGLQELDPQPCDQESIALSSSSRAPDDGSRAEVVATALLFLVAFMALRAIERRPRS